MGKKDTKVKFMLFGFIVIVILSFFWLHDSNNTKNTYAGASDSLKYPIETFTNKEEIEPELIAYSVGELLGYDDPKGRDWSKFERYKFHSYLSYRLLKRHKILQLSYRFKYYPEFFVIPIGINEKTKKLYILDLDGRDDFNKMIEQENIEIKDEETAMELAKSFILIHTAGTIVFLDKASDIKLFFNAQSKARYLEEVLSNEELKERRGNLFFSHIGENPLFTREEFTPGDFEKVIDSVLAIYQDSIKAPGIEHINADYFISVSTFHIRGRLTHWCFVIHQNGTLEWERNIIWLPILGMF